MQSYLFVFVLTKGRDALKYVFMPYIQSIIELLFILAIGGGIILGLKVNYAFFSIIIVAVMFLWFFQTKQNENQAKKYRERIQKQWGKEHKEERDILHIKKYYNFFIENDKASFIIDDITWKDLNMDSVFSKIDHTMSLPGMQYLYDILRKALFKEDVLRERNNIINLLVKNKDFSQLVQYPLLSLGKKDGNEILPYFQNGIDIDKRPLVIYTILSYLPFFTIIIMFINLNIGLFSLILIAMLNTAVYYFNKNKIYEEMATFKYLGNLIKCSESIAKLDIIQAGLNQAELKDLLKIVNKTGKNISKINFNESFRTDMQFMLDYYNIVFLREPKIFYKTINLINKHKTDLHKLYLTIGKIDAYISIASYKDSLSYYTEPQLKTDESTFFLKAEQIYHPLLDKPVPYSIELNNEGALITGSNASGKSTFLRTIGVNALFAQTLFLVLARSYRSNYYKLLTSIGATDNIIEGDSYFMAEAKSLKRIIDLLDPRMPILCILDEIFRGTNTAERISAAKESLNYMIEKNCCVIAATHDLELTSLVEAKYRNYHFQEIIAEHDIRFDYILHKGACTSRNGIAILKYLGYPTEIHEKASIQAQNYFKN